MKMPSSPRVFAAAVVLAVASSVTLSAAAFEGPRHGMRHHHGDAMMMGGGPMHGRMLEHMLDSVKATDAQRAQIRQIAEAAKADMKGQREQRRALREQGMQVFTQPNIDANAVEALRQQMLALHDQASKRQMAAMLEISRVLTPEQRQQIAEHTSKRREMMQRHMRERAQLHGHQPGR